MGREILVCADEKCALYTGPGLFKQALEDVAARIACKRGGTLFMRCQKGEEAGCPNWMEVTPQVGEQVQEGVETEGA
jgi:hypothetical protein